KLGSGAKVGYIPPNQSAPPVLGPAQVPTLTILQGIPIFFEESGYFYNSQYRDAMFGNQDQLTNRHDFGGHVSFLDGSVALLKLPTDRDEKTQNTQLDFQAEDLYISTKLNDTSWFGIADSASHGWGDKVYGWGNAPRYPAPP